MLVDELIGNLDSLIGERVVELIFCFYEECGMMLVMIIYDKDFVVKCDCVVSMVDG